MSPQEQQLSPIAAMFQAAERDLQNWDPSKPLPVMGEQSWLRSVEPEATSWWIDNRIPYGLCTISAPPGVYKSALADQIAHLCAFDVPIPGADWTPNRRGSVLVISPDESMEEARNRTFRICPFGTLVTDGEWRPNRGKPDIIRMTSLLGDTVEERIENLWKAIEYLEVYGFLGSTHHIITVIWDTVGALLGPAVAANAYEHADKLKGLNARLALERRVMITTNHIGKSGLPIGSVAVISNSNLAAEIKRTRGTDASLGTISATKLRGAQPWTLALEFEDGLCKFLNETPQLAMVQHGHLPEKILQVIKDRPMTAEDLSKELKEDVTRSALASALMKMRDRGLIRSKDRIWGLTDMGSVQPTSPNVEPPPKKTGSDLPAPSRLAWVPNPLVRDEKTGKFSGVINTWNSLIEDTHRLKKTQLIAHPYPSPAEVPPPLRHEGPGKGMLVHEGAHHWVNPTIASGSSVTTIDRNGSFLGVLGSAELPIGRLRHEHGSTPDPAQVGLHRIDQWPTWDRPDLPHPGGAQPHGRELWITTPTLKLLRQRELMGLGPFTVLESWLGAKMRLEQLAAELRSARQYAIDTDDQDLLDYVKATYSIGLATMGESSANTRLWRPDWVAIIRATFHANMDRAAHRIAGEGIPLAAVCHTDEIHVCETAADVFASRAVTEGQALSHWKRKGEPYSWTGRPRA